MRQGIDVGHDADNHVCLMASVLILMAAQHEAGLAAPSVAHAVDHLHFSFETGLLALSCLLVVSIFTEKVGLQIGIPGSIFLFFAGLFSHISGFSFEGFPLEEIHVVALSVLLFFGGLSFDRSLLRRRRQLLGSVCLAVFGTIFSMIVWFFYLRFGFGLFQSSTDLLPSVSPKLVGLMTVVVVTSIAVQDWNAFAFVSGKVKNFGGLLTDVFKVETAISASIAVAVAEVAILLWMLLNPAFVSDVGGELLVQVFHGIWLGAAAGLVLGFALTLVIRFLVTTNSQLVLAALAFIFAGYTFTYVVVHQGGYLCALVMGVVTSLAYRSSSIEGEVEFLSKSLESVNIASEAILFFVVGCGLDAAAFFSHLPIALYAWIGVIALRPVCVALFFHGDHVLAGETFLLSLFSPKGAISMALVVTAPAMLEETFGLDVPALLPPSSFNFMADVVCGVVVISMIFKSLYVPLLHRRMVASE